MVMRQRTFHQVDERISVQGLGNGRHVVKVTPGGARIVAYVSDGKATRFAAEAPDGKRQALFGIVPDSADTIVGIDGSCEVCTFDPDAGTVLCYPLLECPPFVGPEKMGPHF
jgi:hypothetical protein